MLVGQMSGQRISPLADYLQVDVCGLSVDQVREKCSSLPRPHIPIMLHADWEKIGDYNAAFLDSGKRIAEYRQMAEFLGRRFCGITLHPPLRSKVSWTEFKDVLRSIPFHYQLENRSNKRFLCSSPEEIKELVDGGFPVCLDIPQLFITFNKDRAELRSFLDSVKRVRELHLGNVKLIGGRPYVAQAEGVLEYSGLNLPKAKFCTIEVLGGVRQFEAFYVSVL